jgi:hypothetical protein
LNSELGTIEEGNRLCRFTNTNAKNVMEYSNTLYSGVMIPFFALTAKTIVSNGSCLPAASRAVPAIHHLLPRQDALPVQAKIVARVTDDVISGSPLN